MLSKTKGIILQKRKYAESSLVVAIYTREFGLISYLVQGARRKNSTIRSSILQVFSCVDLIVDHKTSRGLQRIREVKSDFALSSIPFDMNKSAIALFLSEVLHKSIREEESNPELYDFIHHGVQWLDLQSDRVGDFHLLFLVKLAGFLGFYPQQPSTSGQDYFDLKEGIFASSEPGHNYFMEPTSSKILKSLLGMKFDELSTLEISRMERKRLLDHLILFYRIHIEGMRDIKSHEVLEVIYQ